MERYGPRLHGSGSFLSWGPFAHERRANEKFLFKKALTDVPDGPTGRAAVCCHFDSLFLLKELNLVSMLRQRMSFPLATSQKSDGCYGLWYLASGVCEVCSRSDNPNIAVQPRIVYHDLDVPLALGIFQVGNR